MLYYTSKVYIKRPNLHCSLFYVLSYFKRKAIHLEVLIVVEEGRSLEAVGDSTGSLHTIGHARRPTGEHSNLGKKDVLLLQVVKELVEVWTTKMSDSSKSSEQTLATQPLKVTLTDVLQDGKIYR